jgi:hypothetical protein
VAGVSLLAILDHRECPLGGVLGRDGVEVLARGGVMAQGSGVFPQLNQGKKKGGKKPKC